MGHAWTQFIHMNMNKIKGSMEDIEKKIKNAKNYGHPLALELCGITQQISVEKISVMWDCTFWVHGYFLNM